MLENHPTCIDREYLGSISPKFKDFLSRQGTRSKEVSIEEALEITREKPIDEVKSLNSKYTASSTEEDNASGVNSDTVTLDELYQTLSILKKAKLSTQEIEERINQVQRNASLRQYALDIASIIETIANTHPIAKQIYIECIPKEFIKIKIGNENLIFDLNDGPLNWINSGNPEAKSKTKQVPSLLPNTVASEEERVQTPRVWIKPHTDRTFAVCGDTDCFIDILKSFGGRKTINFKNENEWIFLIGKKEGLEKELGSALINQQVIEKGSSQNISEPQISVVVSDKKLSKDDKLVSKYRSILTSLKTFNFLGVTGPHKAILLIAIFDLVKSKRILENKIYFNDDLEQQYNDYWSKIMGGTPSLGAAYPYAHLGNDSFVVQKRIRPLNDYNITWNRQKIRNYISYLLIDSQLFSLLKVNSFNRELTQLLVDYYCSPKFNPKLLESNTSGNQNVKDHREGFKRFLNTSLNNSGKAFSASSIGVYVGALGSDYIKSIVKKYCPTGNIFVINEINILTNILLKIDEDIQCKNSTPGYRVAVKHYIKFITSLTVQ